MDGLHEMFGRLGWSVPEDRAPKNAAVCKRCTHEVLWCRYDGGRIAPFNRDGTRHPMDCRITINQVRRSDHGQGALKTCPYCDDRQVRYPARDLQLHVAAMHKIARTLPRA